jgi:hypothetical protein
MLAATADDEEIHREHDENDDTERGPETGTAYGFHEVRLSSSVGIGLPRVYASSVRADACVRLVPGKGLRDHRGLL